MLWSLRPLVRLDVEPMTLGLGLGELVNRYIQEFSNDVVGEVLQSRENFDSSPNLVSCLFLHDLTAAQV